MSVRVWAGSWLIAVLVTTAATATLYWGPLAGPADARRGAAALAEGSPLVALEHLERALQSHPTDEVRYHFGTALIGVGRYEAAARELERALEIGREPELRRRTLHNLALARLRQALALPPGERGAAALASVAAGREALRLDPDRRTTRVNLALAENLVDLEPPPQAPDTDKDRGGRTLASAGWDADEAPMLLQARAEVILDGLRSAEAGNLQEALARLLGSGPRLPVPKGGRPW